MIATDTIRDTIMADLADRSLARSFSYVDGRWVGARTGDTLEVTNPADGRIVAEVARLSPPPTGASGTGHIRCRRFARSCCAAGST